jgi:hypothetical protein
LIIASISGGPGNQLFQYAFAKSLALRFEHKLVLDIGFYRSAAGKAVTKREYVLPNLLEEEDLPLCVDLWRGRLLRKSLILLDSARSLVGINSSLLNFKETVPFCDIAVNQMSQKSHIFLNGFFQTYNPAYDLNIALSKKAVAEVIDLFQPQLISRLSKPGSISVSVRKGQDYMGATNICSTEYYERAVNTIKKTKNIHHDDIEIFLFSDNIEWCRKELLFKGFQVNIIETREFKVPSWQCDLVLGHLCPNHVISNSTFSWWVAYFAKMRLSTPGIVVCPDKWWTSLDARKLDIYPPHWCLLSTSHA